MDTHIPKGDWKTLWSLMGSRAPCKDWRDYVEATGAQTVSTALRFVHTRIPAATKFNALGDCRSDAIVAAAYLTDLTGCSRPSTQQVLKAIRQIIEEG